MIVMLGNMELRASEKPESVQHGGGQHITVNEFPGGNTSIQNFGPKYREISWEGWFEGTDAMQRMYQIGNMRQKGDPLLFVTEGYSCNVVITEFNAEHRTNFFIPFEITLARIVQITKDVPKEAVDKAAEKIVEKEKAQEGTTAAASASPSAEGTKKTYIVQENDNMTRIAKKFYGNDDYSKIYEANRSVVRASDLMIRTGTELIIP